MISTFYWNTRIPKPLKKLLQKEYKTNYSSLISRHHTFSEEWFQHPSAKQLLKEVIGKRLLCIFSHCNFRLFRCSNTELYSDLQSLEHILTYLAPACDGWSGCKRDTSLSSSSFRHRERHTSIPLAVEFNNISSLKGKIHFCLETWKLITPCISVWPLWCQPAPFQGYNWVCSS